jgi:hypothetical protein
MRRRVWWLGLAASLIPLVGVAACPGYLPSYVYFFEPLSQSTLTQAPADPVGSLTLKVTPLGLGKAFASPAFNRNAAAWTALDLGPQP